MNKLLHAGAVALALIGLTSPASSQDKVLFQIDGAPVPFYAPLFAGVEAGKFSERGIEVEFVFAAASDILTNIAAGNVQFGFPNGDSVIAAAANGLPVKVVHTTYQRGIGALLAKAESGIVSYADLEGKTVAITSLGSPNYLQLQVGLQQAGLSLDDVQLEIISTGAIVQSLQAGQVDAIVFSELRKYQLEAAGEEVSMILSNDFLPSFGNVIVTSDRFLSENPDLISRFVEAVTASYKWVIDGHIEDALRISIEKYTPAAADQIEYLKTAFENTFVASVWQSSLTEERGLGAADLEAWQRAADTLFEFEVITQRPVAADFVIDPAQIGN